MDLSEKDMFGQEKRSEDNLRYHEPIIPADWRFGNQQPGLFTLNSTMSDCQGDQAGSSSSSASMVGSFGRYLWSSATTSSNSVFCDATVQMNPAPPLPRLEVSWSPTDVMPKGGIFLQSAAGILPPSLSQFPTDSAFTERAARFSCFNGVDIGGVVNPFGATASSIPLSNGEKIELNVGEASKAVSMSVENGSNVVMGSPLKARRGKESSHHEFSVGDQEEAPNSDSTAQDPSSMGFSDRKRKRGIQEMDLDQAERANRMSLGNLKENTEGKQVGGQKNSTSPATKPSGRHGKDTVDAPKEDYVHVRARRGQATNSHSLAERVRREKISERMKFLQDLVPGCSKVTGKAVMLDEIINYVQSLQRQVEFLSMKLAAVNPRLDFNIEGLLSKEILQSRAVASTIGFSPDTAHHPLHPAQQVLVQLGLPSIGNPSDALRRAINAQLTTMNAYRESTNQVQIPNTWENELPNVVHMGFGGNATLNIQELHGLPPPGHMKVEP